MFVSRMSLDHLVVLSSRYASLIWFYLFLGFLFWSHLVFLVYLPSETFLQKLGVIQDTKCLFCFFLFGSAFFLESISFTTALRVIPFHGFLIFNLFFNFAIGSWCLFSQNLSTEKVYHHHYLSNI